MTHRNRALALACALLFSAAESVAEFSPEKLALIDRPFQGDRVALAPDGKHLAYTAPGPDRLWLVLLDLERKTQRSIPLVLNARPNAVPAGLADMRWVSADRLVLVNSDSEIVSIDATGAYPRQLWNKGSTGLVNDREFTKEKLIVKAGLPRLHPPLADRPGTVLIESVAHIGAETFSNAYVVDAASGEAELLNASTYLGGQIALYGRGDMLMWPPLPYDLERWVAGAGTGSPGLVDVARYLNSNDRAGGGVLTDVGTPAAIRSKMEMFLAFPPEMDGDTLNLRGWPASPRDPPPPPPASISLIPETGGSVTPDSSASGRMLYDRQGRPRLLYTENTRGGPRTFLYTAPGRPVFEPNQTPESLDRVLGQPKPSEFLVSAENYFGERSYPLAFDYDPNVLYYASNVGRDTFGLYSLNLATRERKEIAPEIKGVDLASGDPSATDDILVFDDARKQLVGVRFASLRRNTRWLDAEIGGIQRTLEEMMPRHEVEIVSWDTDRKKFLANASAVDDPGASVLYHREENRLEVLFSRTPWLADKQLSASGPIGFETPAGVRLTGYLTLPNDPFVNPPPLIIYAQGGLWDRATPGFNREAEMLADMGVAVLRLNYRGTAGFGRQHLTAIQQGIDTIPTEDLIAAVEWLAAAKRIDRTRVGIMGEGFGGYVALRAVQLHPDIFRAAIALNAPTNLDAWARPQSIQGASAMYRDGTVERGTTVDFRSEVRAAFIKQAKRLSGEAPPRPAGAPARPLLVIESSDSSDTTPFLSAIAGLGLGLRGLEVEHLRIRGPFEGGSPETRAEVFARIDKFLTASVYNFEVEIGTLKEVAPTPPAK